MQAHRCAAPYTNETCPALPPHVRRPDPASMDCALRVAAWSSSSFLAAMRGRTLALVGDSMAEQQFTSLICLLAAAGVHASERWHDTPAATPDAPALSGGPRPTPTRRCAWYADALFALCMLPAGRGVHRNDAASLSRVAESALGLVSPADVLLMHGAVHYSPKTFEAHLSDLMETLGRRCAHSSSCPALLWREAAAQHFAGGVCSGRCQNEKACVPHPSPHASPPHTGRGPGSKVAERAQAAAAAAEVSDPNPYNGASLAALAKAEARGLPVHLIRAWASSSGYHTEHPPPAAVTDCTHYLLPGVPDGWNEEVLRTLREEPRLSTWRALISPSLSFPERAAPANHTRRGGRRWDSLLSALKSA